MEELLSHDAIQVNIPNDEGTTALHYFVRCWGDEVHERCESIFARLLERGIACVATSSIQSPHAQHWPMVTTMC
jgi:hypothetical protein